MVRILLMFIASFMIHVSLAQKMDTDSLKDLLNKHRQDDSVKLNLLNNLSYAYYQLNPEEGIPFADKAIALAQKLSLPVKLAEAFYYKGMNMNTKGNYAEALDLYNRSIKIFKTAGNEQPLWSINNSMAIVYMNLSDYEKALDLYFKNMLAAERLKDEKKIALSAANISLLYIRIDKSREALQYNKKAIDIYSRRGDNKGLADSYATRGNIYDNMNQPKDAINSYREGLRVSEPVSYELGIANNNGNMGSVYGEIEKYDSAFYCTKKGLEIYERIGYKRNMAILNGYLGDIILTSPDSALLKENILPAKKYAGALEYYNKELALHKEAGNVLEEAEAWQQIKKVYKLQANYEQAYNAFENYTKLKDSALNENKNKAIEKLSSQYEFQKKADSIKEANDKKMIIVSAEIKREKAINNAMLFGGIILATSSLIIFIFYKRNRDINSQKLSAEFSAQVAHTEMKALRAQMNPHFIYNSLNSINDYIDKHDTTKATSYTTKFAKLMRMILENSEKKEIPLADDLKALELYMQLENMRLRHKFTYDIQVAENIDVENTLIPPLILQPFVENSIWHGFSNMEGEGKIQIHIKKECNMINCIVMDNGIGRAAAAGMEKTQETVYKNSLGMKITRARIDILNKLKRSNAVIHLSDLEEGTKIEVSLPEELAF